MGPDRDVFWALLALVAAFVAVFGVLLWLRLTQRWREEQRGDGQRPDASEPDERD